MTDLPQDAPFFRAGPEQPATPVVLSVPHAGRAYSATLLRGARVSKSALEALEDRLVDRLVWRAIQDGATAFVALAPRAEIDLNRDEREVDPALIAPPPPASAVLQSARTRGGLGLIPSRISGTGAIWLKRLGHDELRRRVETIHRPFHEAIAEALAAARARFGVAILLDCHSMPPRAAPPGAGPMPTLVFGDRHGTAIAPTLLAAAIAAADRMGYSSSCNSPYAGGYVVSRHGAPAAGIHALQIEIDRSAYLDDTLREAGKGFDRAAHLFAAIAAALAEQALGLGAEPIAAE